MTGPEKQKEPARVEVRVRQHVALALDALRDNDARARVLQWACEHFQICLPGASPAVEDNLALGTFEELSAAAEQNAKRLSGMSSPDRRKTDHAPNPKDNDAVHAWLNALRI
jgi:hypothetical protein